MSRKQALCYVIIASIFILFLLILLAVFFFPAMLMALLVLIFLLGKFKRRYPEFFDLLKKPKEDQLPLMPHPTEPLKHTDVKKALMMLTGLNNSSHYSITVDEESFLIGRAKGCNFVLDDPMVSRRHLNIEYSEKEKTCYAIDISANGTYLNSERMKPHERYALKQGDSLQIASIVFSVEYARY